MSGNFIGYLIGYIIVVAGVGYGLSLAGVPSEWIIAVVLVLIGLGIVYALSRSNRDTAARGASQETKTTRENGPAGESTTTSRRFD